MTNRAGGSSTGSWWRTALVAGWLAVVTVLGPGTSPALAEDPLNLPEALNDLSDTLSDAEEEQARAELETESIKGQLPNSYDGNILRANNFPVVTAVIIWCSSIHSSRAPSTHSKIL